MFIIKFRCFFPQLLRKYLVTPTVVMNYYLHLLLCFVCSPLFICWLLSLPLVLANLMNVHSSFCLWCMLYTCSGMYDLYKDIPHACAHTYILMYANSKLLVCAHRK